MLSTLDKGLRILEAVATADAPRGLTLTELGRLLGMHRTTLLRFLVTLRARGYLDRDPATDRYRLGVQVLTLAATWLNDLDIRQVAKPLLQNLCDRSQELVHLTILDRSEVVTIERIEGSQPISLQTEIGNRRPAYCTASGKAILAHLAPDALDRIVAPDMVAVTPRTITSRELLRQDLADIRERGYAIDDEEHFEGVRCVAAPVFNYDRSVVASISIAGPAQRVPPERIALLGEEVRTVAEAISRRLGCPGPPTATTAGAA
ncbi:MAG: IclR family transcriptional regulator [Thermomicrobiales bacterium]